MLSGTSTSAPVGAGVAALMIGKDPSLSPDDVKVRMMGTADPLPGATRFQQGAGLLDAAGALASECAVANGYALSEDVGDGTTILTQDDYAAWDQVAWTKYGWTKFRWTKFRWTKFRWTKFRWTGVEWTEVPVDEVPVDGHGLDQVPVDEVPVDQLRLGEVQVDDPHRRAVSTETPELIGHDETAVRKRTAVSLYVALVCAAAAGVSIAAVTARAGAASPSTSSRS